MKILSRVDTTSNLIKTDIVLSHCSSRAHRTPKKEKKMKHSTQHLEYPPADVVVPPSSSLPT